MRRAGRHEGLRTSGGCCRAVQWVVGLVLIASGVLAVAPARAEQALAGQLFPEPFLVEHHLVQTLPDGDVFGTEPVIDYYGGSWIVSVRADGSRLVVDFARRELMEIRPERGTFSVLSFDRFTALTRRLQEIERSAVAKGAEDQSAERRSTPEIRYTVSETAAREGVNSKSARLDGGRDPLVEREGVRRLEVAAFVGGSLESAASMVVWLDPQIRLTLRAQAAMEELEATVLAGGSDAEAVGFSRLAAEARKASGGALVFRTRRPLILSGASETAGFMDDVALRVEMIEAFPSDLLSLPENIERAPHPLEMMVSHAEREADLRTAMSAAHDPRRTEGAK